LKAFKKDKKGSEFSFIGGWFEKKWQDGNYVDELANVPTKEELLSKLCYLFNYPLQSFACVISEVAKKNGGEVEEVKAEVKEEPKVEEAKVEAPAEVKEEVKEEPKVEEVKAEEVKAEETPAA